MYPFDTYTDLREAVDETADHLEAIGHAPGGDPVLGATRNGRTPSIVLTAGSHATEHAGVVAAVTLLDRLETDRQLVVVPSRDPVGVSGLSRAMELATGDAASLDAYEMVDRWIREHGDIVFEERDVTIGLVGEYCFASAPAADGLPGTKRLKAVLTELEDDPHRWEQLHGRRIFLVPGQPSVAGTGDFDRLYTLVVAPDGSRLHLNRYLGSRWAPAESRAVTKLLHDVEPGLFVDIHEYLGDGNWISIRPMDHADARQNAEQIGEQMNATHAAAGRKQTPLSEFHPDDGDGDSFLSELEPGLFDLDYVTRGEGFNATDYAAERGALAFTHETGMYNPFDDRVTAAVEAVQTAVDTYEEITA